MSQEGGALWLKVVNILKTANLDASERKILLESTARLVNGSFRFVQSCI